MEDAVQPQKYSLNQVRIFPPKSLTANATLPQLETTRDKAQTSRRHNQTPPEYGDCLVPQDRHVFHVFTHDEPFTK